MAKDAFEKRIKRRVTAREHTFFAICSPGIETICMAELKTLGVKGHKMKRLHGGVEFDAKPAAVMALNFCMRTASRILMRIAQFRAESFLQLEKKFSDIEWMLYLPKCTPSIQVTARKSRLYHSDAISQRCRQVVAEYFLKNTTFMPAADDNAVSIPGQTIFVRAEKNVFTISVDSSGELLFKRGIKKRVTPAPLRENLACALLHLAGFSGMGILQDPMCGSGTFSIEAAMISLNMPPGTFRRFSFEHWPCFSPKAFLHLKKELEKRIIQPANPHIFASDIDFSAVTAIQENISSQPMFLKSIETRRVDFFDLPPLNHKGLIVLNPPYGKRLGSTDQVRSFFKALSLKLRSDFRGWHLGILVPDQTAMEILNMPLRQFSLVNGGLEILAGVGRIS